MLKRLITTIIIMLIGVSVNAQSNYLNGVVMEKTDTGYNVILRSDAQTKIKKVLVNGEMILTLKNIEASDTLSTLYKDTPAINSVTVENVNNSDLKIYIKAPDLTKTNIVFETPDSAPITVNDYSGLLKFIWIVLGMAMIMIISKSSKIKTIHHKYAEAPDLYKDIKNRELELYRKSGYRPDINYKINNSRYATSPARKKGDTIRSFEYQSQQACNSLARE